MIDFVERMRDALMEYDMVGHLGGGIKIQYEARVRAAIGDLREAGYEIVPRQPTKSMMLAPCGEMIDTDSIINLPVGGYVSRGSIFFGPEDAAIVWQKMIDAALG